MKLAGCFFLVAAIAFAQRAIKPIPAPGIEVPAADRAELEAGLARLRAAAEKLKGNSLLADVLIYSEAVRFALQYNEFFKPAEIAAAKTLLQQGEERAAQLAAGQAPWTTATGLQCQQVRRRSGFLRSAGRGEAAVRHRPEPHPGAGMWAAASPGAGFAETAQYQKIKTQGDGAPPWWEQKLWHYYDAVDYAANLFQLPTIAYNGEIDPQKQAGDMMERAMAEEGMHWERARVDAGIAGGTLSSAAVDVTTSNVTAFTLEMGPGGCPLDVARKPVVTIDGQRLAAPAPGSDRSWSAHFRKSNNQWSAVDSPVAPGLHKRHGLQGPVDDAFLDSFIFVTPTGTPLAPGTAGWVASEQKRAIADYASNSLQTPKLPDYAIVDTATPPGGRFPGKIVLAGFFNEDWGM